MTNAQMQSSPSKRTVAIIGAGIVGVSTALHCLRDGHDVLLIDKSGPAAGASHGNGGVLASCSIVPISLPGLWKKAPGLWLNPNEPLFLSWSYLPRLAPWLIQFLRNGTDAAVQRRAAALSAIIGDSLDDHLALASGSEAARWIVPSDYLFLYNDKAHYQSDAYAWEIRKRHGFEWDTMDADEFRAFDPVFGSNLGFAARLGNHGRIADPGRYVKDLATHAQSLGARLIIGEAQDIVHDQTKVTGVQVGGDTIPCDTLVLATGAWSSPLARKMGIVPPLETERGYHLDLWEPSVMPRAPVMICSGKFVVTPMDGRLRLAGVVELGGLDAPPSRAPFHLLEKNIQIAIPGITWKKSVEWMGHRPSMADSIPVIGESPSLKGAYMGFGHDHVGLTAGPKTGKLLAQLISGRRPNVDMSPYAPARFT